MSTQNLPSPNAHYRRFGDPPRGETDDESAARGRICNPLHAGLMSFLQGENDEAWIKDAARLIREEGPEQFLVNMLHVLRESLADDPACPAHTSRSQNGKHTPASDLDKANLQKLADVEGLVYCSHDDFPMILVDGDFVCLAEFAFSHLDHSPVIDLISRPILSLVFQNGHTLPLIDPKTGGSLAINDEDYLLNTLNGLALVDLGWDDDLKLVILEFGQPMGSILDEDSDQDPLEALEVHLDSIRRITCPSQAYFPEDED